MGHDATWHNAIQQKSGTPRSLSYHAVLHPLSINTYGGTEIPVFRRCMAGITDCAVPIISVIKK